MLRLNYSDHEEMNDDDITLYRVYKKKWRRQGIEVGGTISRRRGEPARRVRGHAPPGKILKSGIPETQFPGFSG